MQRVDTEGGCSYPVTYLGFGLMGLSCKVWAILWVLFLSVGPHPERMRWKLTCIFSFCTDWGTEVEIVNSRDCLPELLVAIGVLESVAQIEGLT